MARARAQPETASLFNTIQLRTMQQQQKAKGLLYSILLS